MKKEDYTTGSFTMSPEDMEEMRKQREVSKWYNIGLRRGFYRGLLLGAFSGGFFGAMVYYFIKSAL